MTLDEEFEQWKTRTSHKHGNFIFSGTTRDAFFAGIAVGRAVEQEQVMADLHIIANDLKCTTVSWFVAVDAIQNRICQRVDED